MRARHFTFAVFLGLTSVGSWSAAPTPPALQAARATVPAGVILVKGAWSSASDSTTPVPEGGKVSARDYRSDYFQLTYRFADGWKEKFEGPPPSDRGYYVLAQIEPVEEHVGSVLIEAQDLFFGDIGSHLRADYKVERPPTEVTVAGRPFTRLDYYSPVTELHWTVLATQMRCHAIQVTFTSTSSQVIDQQITAMQGMTFGGASPLCVKGYNNVLNRVDPILTDRRFNSIPVRVVIDTSGKVKFIHFISSFPDQARTITEALQQWRFEPYVSNGKAVELETGILFGVQPNRPLISGKQDPQLPPARKHATT
jgi:hypothetical protein